MPRIRSAAGLAKPSSGPWVMKKGEAKNGNRKRDHAGKIETRRFRIAMAIWHTSIAPPLSPCRKRAPISTETFSVIPQAREGQRESEDAGDEDTFTAEAIGPAPPVPISTIVTPDGIGIHDPLKLPEIRVQHLFQCWQDRRNAGNFQSEHQGGETDGSERHGASAARWGGNGKGHSSAFQGSVHHCENRSVEEAR
ncbi:hypothetical protein L1887_57669 [Cichorium endivia]|nr:hypothetical protein L1887_57669 [Cichorium endivia]